MGSKGRKPSSTRRRVYSGLDEEPARQKVVRQLLEGFGFDRADIKSATDGRPQANDSNVEIAILRHGLRAPRGER